MNGFNSNVYTITRGVPHSSYLRPLLFLIYINDFHITIRHCKVLHFADDNNLLNFNECPKKLHKYLNLNLKSLRN